MFGDRVRVLERVRRVGVVGAAAVLAELLDRLLAGDRTAGDRLRGDLRRLVDGRRDGVAVEVLHDALAHEHDAEDERDRQQDAHDGAGEVDPEVAEVCECGCGRARGSAR